MWYNLETDPTRHQLKLTRQSDAKPKLFALTYKWTGSDHLVLDGEIDGDSLTIQLHKMPPSLLDSRSFEWVEEVSYNR